MATFRDANQARLKMKMKLSQLVWYNSSVVLADSDGYFVTINVKRLDNQVRKLVPPIVDGVSVKVEAE